MNRLLPLVLLTLPSISSAQLKVHSSDFHPNPNFKMVRRFDAPNMARRGNVEQLGEVVILEGDDDLVSTSQSGWGIVFDGRAQNPVAITNRFYSKYGDDFDEIIVFTTFDDNGASGALAYEISAQQDVQGIGQDLFDDSASWGSTGGKLHAFVNMMKWSNFDSKQTPLADPRNQIYPVLGQEFAHRWLSFLHYKDQAGNVSTAMLGRDGAHWASTLQADGSVMDGNELTVDNDGFYQTSNLMTRYSTLDLYGMGLIAPDEVQPWFLIKNAVTSKGRTVDPTQYLPSGAKIKGNREDITIDQVLAAEGQRMPSFVEAPHAFRTAFVLLTHPGERAADAIDAARKLDTARVTWEQQFKVMSAGRGSVCTQVSAPCGAIATAHIDRGEIIEHGGNHNGVAEPGEPVLVTFHVLNDSQVLARQIEVAAAGDFVSDASSTVIPALQPSEGRDVVFAGTLPADAVCGQAITIDASSTVDGHTFRGFAELVPGVTVASRARFELGRDGFVANPDGHDSAVKNGWAFGVPESYGNFFVYQPNGCHSGTKCWFTGLEKGHRAMMDSSLEAGESHLYSRPFDLSKTYLPVLSYQGWFQAIDYSMGTQMAQEATGVSMTVEGSTDGGKSWTTVDTISSSQDAWQPRQIPLDGLVDTKGELILRFTAMNPVATNQVEAGLDELQITTLTASCNPDQPAPEAHTTSGGCSFGGSAPISGLVMILFVAVLLRRRFV